MSWQRNLVLLHIEPFDESLTFLLFFLSFTFFLGAISLLTHTPNLKKYCPVHTRLLEVYRFFLYVNFPPNVCPLVRLSPIRFFFVCPSSTFASSSIGRTMSFCVFGFSLYNKYLFHAKVTK